MAKLDLIDRTALVEELEGLKAILGDVFLGMVVERAIERVKAQPVVEITVVRVPVEIGCDTCKHLSCGVAEDPCNICIARAQNTEWEWADESL